MPEITRWRRLGAQRAPSRVGTGAARRRPLWALNALFGLVRVQHGYPQPDQRRQQNVLFLNHSLLGPTASKDGRFRPGYVAGFAQSDLKPLPRVALHKREVYICAMYFLPEEPHVTETPTAALHPSLIAAGLRPSAERWTRFIRPDQLYRQARVSRVVKESGDAVSVTLTPMGDPPDAPVAGRYLTLIADIGGQRVKRAYSLSRVGDECLTITSKRVEGGLMSRYLNDQLREGDTLQFAGPSGDFVLPAVAPTHYVFAAAGSGITPIMSMLTQLLEVEGTGTSVTLLYCNRREKDILFRERLDALAAAHDNLTVEYFLTRPTRAWKGHSGRIGIDLVPSVAGSHYFLCGPDSFNETLREALLTRRGVPEKAVSCELFRTLSRESRPHPTEPHPVVFRFGDSEKEVTVRPAETLLEAGLRAGVPMQFSCTMGGCGHCKVAVISGDIATDEPNCLTEPERNAGQALACCAHPHGRASVTLMEVAP